MKFKVMVWGPHACFTIPYSKAERRSYDVMTPSAARNIMQAIYWHPGMNYQIESIQVCKPIKFTNIKTNEVNQIASLRVAYINTQKARTQRLSTILKDVKYCITARVVFDDDRNELFVKKVNGIIQRRLDKGQCFKQPYLGCRDYEAFFEECHEPIECPDELKGNINLGHLLYDIDYENHSPMFFKAKMVDGLIVVPNAESDEVFK